MKKEGILDYILAELDQKTIEYDDIYLFKHHIGELYIMLNSLADYIDYNKSQKPIIIIPEKKYISLYRMFVPQSIAQVYIEIDLCMIDVEIKISELNYRGHRFFIPIPDRFEELRLMISRDEEVHFYRYIRRCMHLGDKGEFSKASISRAAKITALLKVKALELDIDRFVVFFPEAVTASELDHKFWAYTARKLQNRGFDIFVNSVSCDKNWMDVIPNIKRTNLSIEEIYYLCSISSGVIALINGLVVSFAQLDVPRFFIYTDQTETIGERMSAERMLEAYRMDLLPNCNKNMLFEINANKYEEKEISRHIIAVLEGAIK